MPPSPDAEILRRLRASTDSYTPADELGSPAAVDSSISHLTAAGYEIEHHPHRGYRLLSPPDRLIADDILSRLPPCRWIRDVLVFQRTASTNDLVASMARDGAQPGIVIFAEEQTAGRGRLGRRWLSGPRLGLWFSLLLRPDFPLAQWTRLTLWIAYAVAQAIHQFSPENLTPPGVMLKWPNDLFASGRKLAGILVETSLGEPPFAVAGIGLNVNHPSFPPPLDSTATSLRLETGHTFDRNALAAAILASIDQSFSLLPNHFQQILDWAAAADCLRGRSVSASVGDTLHEGIAQGLGPDGALLIRNNDGSPIRLTSGEITRFSSPVP
jgi:BirA family biotin operon repressor/biotin-[acetyl-CoA-carboxylase] ligase